MIKIKVLTAADEPSQDLRKVHIHLTGENRGTVTLCMKYTILYMGARGTQIYITTSHAKCKLAGLPPAHPIMQPHQLGWGSLTLAPIIIEEREGPAAYSHESHYKIRIHTTPTILKRCCVMVPRKFTYVQELKLGLRSQSRTI